ncbi:Sin3 associated polypeptide p18-domain-containing protein [Xylariaceae sp. FL0804]|nr:Sin3 associated polypeptide p18-domain-containing protein [Xylariaceae sp. FL0804]
MDRRKTPPFMLQLFYRTGAFHRPDEFSAAPLPSHLELHTWPDCTLSELAHGIAASSPSLLPDPAIGTRLAFRLIFPDTRSGSSGPGPHSRRHQHRRQQSSTVPRYMIRELGSVVLGEGGQGLDPDDADAVMADQHGHNDDRDDAAAGKTLADARFVVGDYVSVAILPPLPDGAVAPASSARSGRGHGAGELRNPVGRAPGAPRERDPGTNGAGESYGRLSRDGRDGRGPRGGGGPDGFGRGRSSGGGSMPMGEWRRGEQLPDPPHNGWSRGRRR